MRLGFCAGSSEPSMAATSASSFVLPHWPRRGTLLVQVSLSPFGRLFRFMLLLKYQNPWTGSFKGKVNVNSKLKPSFNVLTLSLLGLTFVVCCRPLDMRVYQKINFLMSQPKHMLWLLKRTVSMRRFFEHPQGLNLSSHTRKMRVKKVISEVVFSLLAFSREWKFGACYVWFWGLLSVILILDINLLSSFLKCRSFTVNIFVFIHRKNLSMAEVYIRYNLNVQTHTINSPAWSGLSQSYAF